MGNWMRAALAAVVCGALSVAAVAQTMTVPKDPTVGQTITIGYSDPGRAGATITVTIDSAGFPSLIVLEKEITLDENGNGSVEWVVPEWMAANFNAPGVDEQTRSIQWGAMPVCHASDEADLVAATWRYEST